jgi:hypothetical protein
MDTELEQEFRTRDMNLSACLIVEGIEYLRVEHDAENSRRLIFVFRNSTEISRIQSERANGTHVVSSTNYDDALRRIKTVIHGG